MTSLEELELKTDNFLAVATDARSAWVPHPPDLASTRHGVHHLNHIEKSNRTDNAAT